MTERQQSYIRFLAGSRVLPTQADEIEMGKVVYLTRLLAGEVPAPDVRTAGRIIDWLLELPQAEQAPAASGAPTVDVAAGRYALIRDGVVKFFTVDRPTTGRWTGYTFVNAQASDERHPIRNRQTRDSILAEIAANPREAMQRYADELGRCGFCGRTLTDEVSRAAGIGPDCAQQHGIDRSVWADRQRRDAVALTRNVTVTRADGEDDGIDAWADHEARMEQGQIADDAEREMEIEGRVIEAEERGYTVYVERGEDRRFRSQGAALQYARRTYQADPLRAVLVADAHGDTIVHYDL